MPPAISGCSIPWLLNYSWSVLKKNCLNSMKSFTWNVLLMLPGKQNHVESKGPVKRKQALLRSKLPRDSQIGHDEISSQRGSLRAPLFHRWLNRVLFQRSLHALKKPRGLGQSPSLKHIEYLDLPFVYQLARSGVHQFSRSRSRNHRFCTSRRTYVFSWQ